MQLMKDVAGQGEGDKRRLGEKIKFVAYFFKYLQDFSLLPLLAWELGKLLIEPLDQFEHQKSSVLSCFLGGSLKVSKVLVHPSLLPPAPCAMLTWSSDRGNR